MDDHAHDSNIPKADDKKAAVELPAAFEVGMVRAFRMHMA